MKAFEEFYKKDIAPHKAYSSGYRYTIGKYFWIAALEWVLSRKEKTHLSDECAEYFIDSDEIREELKQ